MATKNVNNLNNVDQIRDLIFGSQIKDFEERFNLINKTMSSMEETLNSKMDESYEKLSKETERALEILEKKIDNLELATQKERTKLKELIDTTDESIQAQLHSQKDEFSTKLKVLKENVSDENKKVLAQVNVMKVEIETALNEGLNTLGDDKLSRDAMAQMLLDVAMKMQGTDINSVLSQGISTEEK